MEEVIKVKNMSFGFDANLVIDNVSFSVEKGDYLGIIGPNGSGKSTLIKLILGILKPVTGEIYICGQNINRFNKWSSLGYISQKANSFNSGFPATVEEVVGANLYSKISFLKRHKLKSKLKNQIERALELVDMKDHIDIMIGNLSGGQQQRVFIARALVSNPDIIFLDEPTSGVDVKSEEALYCLLAKLNRELGITLVMVTHDISAITTHANKLICLGSQGLFMHDPDEEFTKEYLSDLYGYEVTPHIHKHECKNCDKRGAV